jgi:hypothetical protein
MNNVLDKATDVSIDAASKLVVSIIEFMHTSTFTAIVGLIGLMVALTGLIVARIAIKTSKEIHVEQADLALELNRPKISSSIKYLATADKVLIYVEITNDGNSLIEDIQFDLHYQKYWTTKLWSLISLRSPDDIKKLEPGQSYTVPWLSFTQHLYRDLYSFNYKQKVYDAGSDLEDPVSFSLKYRSNNKIREFRFDRPVFQLGIEAGLNLGNVENSSIEDAGVFDASDAFDLIGPKMFKSILLRGDFKPVGKQYENNRETIISFFRDVNPFMWHTEIDSRDRVTVKSTHFGINGVEILLDKERESLAEMYLVRGLLLDIRRLFKKQHVVSYILVDTVDIELSDGSWFRVDVSDGFVKRLTNGDKTDLSYHSNRLLERYADALSYLFYREGVSRPKFAYMLGSSESSRLQAEADRKRYREKMTEICSLINSRKVGKPICYCTNHNSRRTHIVHFPHDDHRIDQ